MTYISNRNLIGKIFVLLFLAVNPHRGDSQTTLKLPPHCILPDSLVKETYQIKNNDSLGKLLFDRGIDGNNTPYNIYGKGQWLEFNKKKNKSLFQNGGLLVGKTMVLHYPKESPKLEQSCANHTTQKVHEAVEKPEVPPPPSPKKPKKISPQCLTTDSIAAEKYTMGPADSFTSVLQKRGINGRHTPYFIYGKGHWLEFNLKKNKGNFRGLAPMPGDKITIFYPHKKIQYVEACNNQHDTLGGIIFDKPVKKPSTQPLPKTQKQVAQSPPPRPKTPPPSKKKYRRLPPHCLAPISIVTEKYHIKKHETLSQLLMKRGIDGDTTPYHLYGKGQWVEHNLKLNQEIHGTRSPSPGEIIILAYPKPSPKILEHCLHSQVSPVSGSSQPLDPPENEVVENPPHSTSHSGKKHAPPSPSGGEEPSLAHIKAPKARIGFRLGRSMGTRGSPILNKAIIYSIFYEPKDDFLLGWKLQWDHIPKIEEGSWKLGWTRLNFSYTFKIELPWLPEIRLSPQIGRYNLDASVPVAIGATTAKEELRIENEYGFGYQIATDFVPPFENFRRWLISPNFSQGVSGKALRINRSTTIYSKKYALDIRRKNEEMPLGHFQLNSQLIIFVSWDRLTIDKQIENGDVSSFVLTTPYLGGGLSFLF